MFGIEKGFPLTLYLTEVSLSMSTCWVLGHSLLLGVEQYPGFWPGGIIIDKGAPVGGRVGRCMETDLLLYQETGVGF